MDDETKVKFNEIGESLRILRDAHTEQTKLNAQIEPLRQQVKTVVLGVATVQPGVLWAQLKLKSGRDQSSSRPEDYDVAFESKTESATTEEWKLDVNERYQKAVGTVISLATAALGAPFVFLKDIHGNQPIRSVLTWQAHRGGYLLALSIVSAVVYYFFSAKWIKLALVNKADLFWIPLKKWFVEFVLDVSYFLMMVGFLAGVYFMVQFMLSYIPK
jgi:hypothetical protein